MATTPRAGPITTEPSETPETEAAVGVGDPMKEALENARKNPPIVPPGIHVPSNQYGPRTQAAKDAAIAEAKAAEEKAQANKSTSPAEGAAAAPETSK